MNKKQAIKAFMKSNHTLFVQRDGDNVLLSNGFFILTIPYLEYKKEFTLISGLFKDLSDGEKFNIRDNSTSSTTADFTTFFKKDDYTSPAVETPFLTDWSTVNNALYRLFISQDKALIYINNSFLEICKAFHENLVFNANAGKAGEIGGIIDYDHKIFILPIKANVPYSVTFEKF